MAEQVDGDAIARWLMTCADEIERECGYLTQLDAAIGDGDHGENMKRGFSSVRRRIDDLGDAESSPGGVLSEVGAELISSVGGASGPLWGVGFKGAGKSLGEAETCDPEQLGVALTAALQSLQDLGTAEEGDKTMVDALAPAVRTFNSEVANGAPMVSATEAAAEAAQEGARATVLMKARKGRAAYLGERSVGHEDPGAASAALIVRALATTFG